MEMKEQDERRVPSVNDQAAEWFIRLRDRDLTMADRRKFVRWLKQSPGHIAEFMRLCQLYGRVKRAKVPTLTPEDVSLERHSARSAGNSRRWQEPAAAADLRARAGCGSQRRHAALRSSASSPTSLSRVTRSRPTLGEWRRSSSPTAVS